VCNLVGLINLMALERT